MRGRELVTIHGDLPCTYLSPTSPVGTHGCDRSSVSLKVDGNAWFGPVALSLVYNALLTANQELVDVTAGKGHARHRHWTRLTILQLQTLLQGYGG